MPQQSGSNENSNASSERNSGAGGNDAPSGTGVHPQRAQIAAAPTDNAVHDQPEQVARLLRMPNPASVHMQPYNTRGNMRRRQERRDGANSGIRAVQLLERFVNSFELSMGFRPPVCFEDLIREMIKAQEDAIERRNRLAHMGMRPNGRSMHHSRHHPYNPR